MIVDPTVGYQLTVNGAQRAVEPTWLGESLLDVLRDRLGLTGAKGACEQGECGSCSIRLDGVLVCSCLVLSAAAVGRDIETVEGFAETNSSGQPTTELTVVQEAFVECGAVQCGFCTPGFIVAVNDLLDRIPEPSDSTIREELAGNLCRCTGYGRIVEAVHLAAERRA